MDFQDFLQFVPQFITAELPAIEAHVKMAPLERITLKPNFSEGQPPRSAAVLMLCYPKNGKTHLVLIVRNEYKGVHSAQIAFPGKMISIFQLQLYERHMKKLEFIRVK